MNQEAYDEAVAHLVAARKLLATPAAVARLGSASGSTKAKQGAEELSRAVARLRARIAKDIEDVRALEVQAAQTLDWHQRYEQVRRLG